MPHPVDIPELSDAEVDAAVDRLHRFGLLSRWIGVGILWLTLGVSAFWTLRDSISLLQEYFTWAAVRYGLIFHPTAAVSLVICFVMTASTLLWQGHFLLWGIPRSQHKLLKRKVLKVWRTGKRHPLWRVVFR